MFSGLLLSCHGHEWHFCLFYRYHVVVPMWSLPTRRSIRLLKQEKKKDDYANSHSTIIFAPPSSSRTIHPDRSPSSPSQAAAGRRPPTPGPRLRCLRSSRIPGWPGPSIGGPPGNGKPPRRLKPSLAPPSSRGAHFSQVGPGRSSYSRASTWQWPSNQL
jgi:hypothetical protein